MNTTTTPETMKEGFTAIPLETKRKKTESWGTRFFARVEFTVSLMHGEQKTFAIGDEVQGEACALGLMRYDPDNLIPWNWIEERNFVVVRECVTTTWEVK